MSKFFFEDKVLGHRVIDITRFETDLSHLHFLIGHSTLEDGNSNLSQGLGHQPPSNMRPCAIRTKPEVLILNLFIPHNIFRYLKYLNT